MTIPGDTVRSAHLYRMARLIRRSQELLMAAYHPANEMRCPMHFCIGQEATPAALSLLLRPGDAVMSHHRSHGYYLAKGGPLDDMVAEFHGKSTGTNGGLAGSQELSHEGINFYSGAILSGMFAMSVGSAFAQKYRHTDAVTVGVIGDGGMDEGIVYEAMNLAAIHRLPVLFLCENNLYSAHSPLATRTLSNSFVSRAEAFGLPARLLDGNDAVLLHDELASLISGIRGGSGPVFVEIATYRTCGHVGPENDDVQNYRPSKELSNWKQRDPVAALRLILIEEGVPSSEIATMDAEIDSAVLNAISRARHAPFPNLDEALELNWSNSVAPAALQLLQGRSAFFDDRQNETKLGPY
jgi:pyruvate dehydrogenase E1 component alpha subunit